MAKPRPPEPEPEEPAEPDMNATLQELGLVAREGHETLEPNAALPCTVEGCSEPALFRWKEEKEYGAKTHRRCAKHY